MQRTFREAFDGELKGVLSWQHLDAIIARISAAAAEGWWVYDTRHAPPVEPVAAAELPAALDAIVAFLRRNHRADYCGFVYADDLGAPCLVKVYDPRNASACSLATPLPAYTISRMRPDALPFASSRPVRDARDGLFARLLKGAS